MSDYSLPEPDSALKDDFVSTENAKRFDGWTYDDWSLDSNGFRDLDRFLTAHGRNCNNLLAVVRGLTVVVNKLRPRVEAMDPAHRHAIDQEVRELRDGVDGFRARLNPLSGEVTKAMEEGRSCRRDLTALQSQVSGLPGVLAEFKTVKNQASSADAKVNALQGKVAAAEGAVAVVATSLAALEAARSGIAGMEAGLKRVEDQVGLVSSLGARIDGVGARLTALEKRPAAPNVPAAAALSTGVIVADVAAQREGASVVQRVSGRLDAVEPKLVELADRLAAMDSRLVLLERAVARGDAQAPGSWGRGLKVALAVLALVQVLSVLGIVLLMAR